MKRISFLMLVIILTSSFASCALQYSMNQEAFSFDSPDISDVNGSDDFEPKTEIETERLVLPDTYLDETEPLLTDPEYPPSDPSVSDIVDTLYVAEGGELIVREVCRIPVGEGAGYIKCKNELSADYGPSNIGFTDDNRIFIVDELQQKLEFFKLNGEYDGSLDIGIDGRDMLTFAVWSKGAVYAVYDKTALYRIITGGEKELLCESRFLSAAVSEQDGRVIVFGSGGAQFIDNDGQLHQEKEFGNASLHPDQTGKKTSFIYYKRDGQGGTFNVTADIHSIEAGIVNGDILLYEYIGRNTQYSLYSPTGELKYTVLKCTQDGEYCEGKFTLIHNGKFYLMICRHNYTVVNELTYREK